MHGAVRQNGILGWFKLWSVSKVSSGAVSNIRCGLRVSWRRQVDYISMCKASLKVGIEHFLQQRFEILTTVLGCARQLQFQPELHMFTL